MKTQLQTLKGFRDFLPAEKRKRDYVLRQIIQTFELWGFAPLETPTIESLDLFKGQIGEDEKLFYQFKDNGDREVALRYDQTVPTCRVVAQYQNQLPGIFKRYQVQPVFRAEKPQRGRYREFLQCDADIFGSASPLADAEVIGLGLDIYRRLGFPQAKVYVNDRGLIKDLPYSAIVAIDKLDKIGETGVIETMVKNGIPLDQAKQYLKQVRDLTPNDTVKTIFATLESYGFDQNWYQFEPTIARSFAYSDGPIWEIRIAGYEAGSVLGGERFDGLTAKISGISIPATGFGLGFDRTVEAAQLLGLIPDLDDAVQVMVCNFDPSARSVSLRMANQLRQAGISTDVYPASDKLAKQFKYASQSGIKFVAVIGEAELAQNQVTLKNMQTGEQKTLDADQVVAEIQVSK